MGADDEAQRRAALLLGCAGVAAVALLAWAPAGNLDTWHYAATGRWVVAHGAVPEADPFSWTFAGEPWQSNGWLWGVVLWGAWSALGAAGVAVLKPLAVLAIGAAVAWAAGALGARRIPAAIAAVASVLGVLPWIGERPQLASFVLFPIVLGLAWRARSSQRIAAVPLLAGVVLVVLWVNLHGAAVLGAVVAAATVGVAGVLDARRGGAARSIAPSAIVGASLCAAVLVNPWGFALLTHASDVRELSRATIDEWYPLWRAGPIAVVPIVIALGVVAAAVRTGCWRRPEVVVAPGLCMLATVDGIRSAPFLVIAAAISLAVVAGPGVDAAVLQRRDLLLVGACALVILAAAVGVPRIASTGAPAPDVPVDAVRALPSGCQLRNDSVLGGWVIFDRADVPVSADGRNDLYGLEGYAQVAWFRSASADGAAAAFLEEGTTCVLALPSSPLPAALVDAGWEVVAADGAAVALVAPGPAEG